ncbi:anti-sigma-D factor RsdA [Pseudonocardia endophytica]|nr:anti-sigma-D factor RsdA [Pseudonocardia endophytica]
MLDEDGPLDLIELQADDELINALSSGLTVSGPGRQGYDADDHLVAMLSAWRADVDAEPMPQLVEPDVAAEALAPQRRSRRVSYLRPVIAAVAVAACGLGVLSVSAHEAQPGDSLWGLSKVLYAERAEQVQAASDLRTGIDRVNAKLASGDTIGAQQDLDAMGPLLAKVEPGGSDQAYFDQQRQFLTAKVAETPPGQPTDPTAPLRNGTAAPLPPSTEGSADPGPGTATSPQAPSGTSPGTGLPPGSTGPGSDPRSLQGPGTGPTAPTTTSPTAPADPTSPTTEGSADPTTTTTRPTASGEGSADPSTTAGGVSSTPR